MLVSKKKHEKVKGELNSEIVRLLGKVNGLEHDIRRAFRTQPGSQGRVEMKKNKKLQRRPRGTPDNPPEAAEQRAVFRWKKQMIIQMPQLALLFVIESGIKAPAPYKYTLKYKGIEPGVPDMFLAYPVSRYHGLFIELKRRKGGRISGDQRDWEERLVKAGYAHVFAYGSDQAISAIITYVAEGVEANFSAANMEWRET